MYNNSANVNKYVAHFEDSNISTNTMNSQATGVSSTSAPAIRWVAIQLDLEQHAVEEPSRSELQWDHDVQWHANTSRIYLRARSLHTAAEDQEEKWIRRLYVSETDHDFQLGFAIRSHFRPNKHFVSEEKMIAHMNGLHLSDNFQEHKLNSEQSKSSGADLNLVNLSPEELEQRLRNAQRVILCDEVRKKLRDDNEIIPKALLSRIDDPCRSMAVVLWRPPANFEQLVTGYERSLDDDEEDMDDINNNNDPNNNMDMDGWMCWLYGNFSRDSSELLHSNKTYFELRCSEKI